MRLGASKELHVAFLASYAVARLRQRTRHGGGKPRFLSLNEYQALLARDAVLRDLDSELQAVADEAAKHVNRDDAEELVAADATLEGILTEGWTTINARAEALVDTLVNAPHATDAALACGRCLEQAILEVHAAVACHEDMARGDDRGAWTAPFMAALTRVQERVREATGSRAPWELEYKLVQTDRDRADGKVSFVGGSVVDADGRPLWVAHCCVTRRVLQHGQRGSGVPRWVSMDRDDAVLSPAAHALVQRLRGALGAVPGAAAATAAAVEALLVRGPMPFLGDRYVEETDVPVFLRLGVRVRAVGLRMGLLDALGVYGGRPCLAVCDGQTEERHLEWMSYAALRARVLPPSSETHAALPRCLCDLAPAPPPPPAQSVCK